MASMRSASDECKICGRRPGERADRERRGRGEGAIYHDCAHGRWEASIEGERDPITGKRSRVKVRARTKPEVLAKLRKAHEDSAKGVTPGAMTVGRWLDHWLAIVVDGRVNSDNTRVNYDQIVRVHLKPALGAVRLDKLTPEAVDRFLKAKADAGLSRSHIGRMRTVLADALRHAERRGLVSRNAGQLAVMPKVDAATPRRSLTADEARKLIAAAAGERLEALIVVGLVVGLRPGELGGLLWKDIVLTGKKPTLTVSGSLKRNPKADGKGYELTLGAVKRSTSGRRTVALPRLAVAALKAHKARQEAEQTEAGSDWENNGLVFCSEVGSALDPSNVRRTFARIAKNAGVDAGFPYLLRHATVSLLIDAGVSIEEAADLLGDDPRTLYRHYRHRVQPVASAGLAMEKVLAAKK